MESPSNETRIAYARALLSAVVADEIVEPEEIARIYETFTALELEQSDRLALLEELAFEADRLRRSELPRSILDNKELSASLAHDALFVDLVAGNDDTGSAVTDLLRKISLTPEQVSVLRQWVEMENSILRKLGAGEDWTVDATGVELSSRAAAVGLPLGALYYAGIVGFGATGLTSGLATIGGMSGLTVLGLNPMTAGIAALIMAGVTVKKVADYALGKKQREELEAAVQAAHNLRLRAATTLASDQAEFRLGTAVDGSPGKNRERTKLAEGMLLALDFMRGDASPA